MNFQLEQITIREPCSADWDSMTGSQRERFCDHCQKSVHDFSQMRAAEVEALVCDSAGSLCARFARDTAGTMITLDYAPRRQRKWLWPVAAFLAGLSFMGSWMGFERFRQPPPVVAMPTPALRGRIAVCPPPTQAPMGKLRVTPPTIQGDVAFTPTK